MTREPIPDVIADCMLKGCQKEKLRAEIERLTALGLKFLNEQTDENAAALRAALEPKP
jgi:hypothetical protein